jgi:hypothetical protein
VQNISCFCFGSPRKGLNITKAMIKLAYYAPKVVKII